MAYEYEHDVISELEQMGVDYQSNGYFNMSIEVEEVYRKARAWDNYMVDIYIYDKVYSDGDHKEACDFYMKPDVKSYIDCLNKKLADTGYFINSVEEYKQILNEIEDK